jgi:hypothetical protein
MMVRPENVARVKLVTHDMQREDVSTSRTVSYFRLRYESIVTSQYARLHLVTHENQILGVLSQARTLRRNTLYWTVSWDAWQVSLSRVENELFGTILLYFIFHFKRTFFQTLLWRRNTQTSKGWHKWMLFGGNKTKPILFSTHSLITNSEKWEPKLSPIRILFRGFLFI